MTESTTSDLRTTANGKIVLTTLAGGITLTEGTGSAGNGAISAHGTGTVTPVAGGTGSDIRVGGTITSGTGSISLRAADTVAFSSGADAITTSTGKVTVTATAGDVTMSTSNQLASGTGTITVKAGDDLTAGSLSTKGSLTLDAFDKVSISGTATRTGKTITIKANDLSVGASLSSAGSKLVITTQTGVPIVLGGATPTTPAMHLSVTELARLKDGFGSITIGSKLANQQVRIDGTAGAVVFNDPVVLAASGAGGSIAITGSVTGDTLEIGNSGTSTTLTKATVTMQRGITVLDALVVSGSNKLSSSVATGGHSISLKTVTGKAGGSADKLTLDANGGNVAMGTVSSLQGWR
ncbi:hypothetical protein HK414_15870 [Ramlibacter terrae]|uniref:Carbohydrate-binding domain-containing protein n=1 Tax=Ramlibacter terrae TaxID=2732511 RepID=A0ABX6P671_9BURK|nr:hypothetical protein HK414_15870 [Ramlibacter terrae]